MQHSNFVHLHLHTQYSLLDGAIRPEALIRLVRGYKMPAVAVTDHGNLFGAVDFYEKAMAGGVKPIIGCEVYVAPGDRADRTPPVRGEGAPAYHLVLLVKNARGYQNLCRLLSAAYIEGFYYKPRVDRALLSEMNEGLIALSACLHGEVAYNVERGRREAAEEAAQWYRETFDNRRFFMEIQHNGMEVQERVNASLVEIARTLDIPLVATNDCHYLEKKDSRYHDVLLCIQTGATVNSDNRMRFSTEELYVKSPEEMIESFKDTPEAIANTIEIAERCNFEMRLGEVHLPDFPLSEGETLDGVIEARAKAGLERRLEAMKARGVDIEGIKWQYYERLSKELKVICGMGFPGYFLIVNDFIEYARGRSIPVGPGRGSAAGSLVAYSLGITSLDPIRYNLLFERFLNPDRISLPDIDIDFCYERRDEVIRYVTEKYGAENVTQIITFGQMKARACIRDVGRALDMPYGDVDRIAKLVPPTLNITIEEALEAEPRLKALAAEDTRVDGLMDVAVALEGLPRHASTHAAGVVISNMPLVEYLPLYKSPKEDVVTTQFPMKDVEKIGLVKFDFLGLKTLTVIDRAVRLIRETRGLELDIENIDLDDAPTYALIASGETNGVFQLESSGIKDLVRKLRPETFEDLTAAVALYRPGPLQSGMVDDFIKRKQKKTAIRYEVDALKEILENTYGVMVYQEQVMEIARKLAGFTPGDADMLRKAMGKKLHDEMLVQRSRFLEGAKKNGITPKKAEKIFDLMAKFAGYGFNKSHSAAYALIAFQTAYLKQHYRIEFMAALLGSDMGNTDQVVKYINECRESSIPVAPPDINGSSREFTVSEGGIRFGLAAIKNVGASAIEEILKVREDGPFGSLMDFLTRVDSRKVNRKVVESLIKAGAFDSTGERRWEIFASLDGAMDTAQKIQRDREQGQGSIFDMLAPAGAGAAAHDRPLHATTAGLTGVAAWSDQETLAYEKETLGFYFSSHPLARFTAEIECYASCAIGGLAGRPEGEEVTVGGLVAESRVINTKKGSRMAFVRIEDTGASVEAVVFADLYGKAAGIIASAQPVFVSGRVEKEGDEVKLIASEMVPIEDVVSGAAGAGRLKSRNTHITAPAQGLDTARLNELKGILGRSPGSSRVYLHVVAADGGEVVIAVDEGLSVRPADELVDEIRGLAPGMEVRVV